LPKEKEMETQERTFEERMALLLEIVEEAAKDMKEALMAPDRRARYALFRLTVTELQGDVKTMDQFVERAYYDL
jgi:hypothetical protein